MNIRIQNLIAKVRFLISFLLSLLLLMLSCQSNRLQLEGVEWERWVSDRKGCEGYRLSRRAAIDRQKDNLLKCSEQKIVRELGRPDKTELIDRSEKYHIYFLNGDAQCKTGSKTRRIYLRIRFNSMGYSKEALILQEKIQ